MTHAIRAALKLTVIAGIVAGMSCDKFTGPKGPTSGALRVTLTTPNADDGAILFVVSGGTIDSVTTTDATMQTMASQATPTMILVRGTLASGVIARVWVADVTATHSASVLQVAARTTYAQRATTGYSMVIAP
jgi:hypothetical protein